MIVLLITDALISQDDFKEDKEKADQSFNERGRVLFLQYNLLEQGGGGEHP